MRYITKELYRASQIGCYLPKPMEEAAEFSEELYQRLFEERLKSRLADRELDCKWALESGEDAPPVDEAAQRKSIEKGIENIIQNMLLEVPEEILAKVADKRVLALDAATPEVIELIQKTKAGDRRGMVKEIPRISHDLAAPQTEGLHEGVSFP